MSERSGTGRSPGTGGRPDGRGRSGPLAVCVLVSLVLTAGGQKPSGPDPPRVLVVEPELLSKLKTLAAGLHAEVVLCLRGSVSADTARATDFYMPAPRLSTSTRAVSDGCPSGALAAWHNHPAGRPGSARPGGDAWLPTGSRGRSAGRLCVLTRRDIETARRLELPFVMVGVDEGTWCWWSLAQVRRMREAPGRPVRGQGEWSPEGRLGTTGSAEGA